jgi:uncharacterized protein YraI
MLMGVYRVMKYRLLLPFTLALLLLTLTFTATAQLADLQTSARSAINLRAGPGVEWRLVGVANAGTTIRLDGQAFGGSWVRGITSTGIVGWMFTQYLNLSPDQAAGLRQIWVEEPFSLSAPAQVDGNIGTGSGTVSVTIAVNVRSGPGTEWRILGQLNPGEPFNVDGRSYGGNWVRGITPGGVVGWIFAQYVNGDVLSLPIVSVDTPFSLSAPTGGAPAPSATTSAPSEPSAPPVSNTASTTGFNLGGHIQNFNDFTLNWMRVAGMTWIKKQWRWERGQDPANVQGLIDQAHASGFRILLGIVGYAPYVNDPGYFEDYAAFVGGVAARGADAIEVWNEPNIDREWAYGSIDPGRYTEMLRQAYFAIKGANPNTLVISGAPAPTGFFGGCSGVGCDDNLFLAGMAAAGAVNYMDCIGIHYNEGIVPPTWTSGDPRGNSTHYSRYYGTMVSTYVNAFGGRRPLCFTELGYLTPEGYGPLPPGFDWAANTTLGQQVAWIDQVVSMARSSGRVRLLIIWNVDFANYGADPMAGFALIRPGGDCPACWALGS